MWYYIKLVKHNFADINENYIWEVGSSSNPNHVSESAIVNAMVVDAKFRFTGDTNPDTTHGTASQLYTITEVKKIRRYNHTRFGRRDGTLFGPASLHKVWKNAHSDRSDRSANARKLGKAGPVLG